MSGEGNPREADFEQATHSLSEGLRSCRAIVDNYRVMLGGESNDNEVEEPTERALYQFAGSSDRRTAVGSGPRNSDQI